jgi:hypothetical protein
MKRRLKVKVDREPRAFLEAFMAAEEPIARAATAAVGEAGARIKLAARADIADAGFSIRWQNALRVDRYPRGGEVSVNTAAHVYHRIPYAIVHEEGATSLVLHLAEIEMRAIEGGADQCTGGTGSASSGSNASNLFDNDTGTSWNGNSTFLEYAQYQFAAPVQVVELAVTAGTGAYAPRVISLQYSDDGVSWTEWAHWLGLGWSDNETKVLNAANRNVIPAGQSPFWRFSCTANNGNANLEVTEVEFRDVAGGPSLRPTAGGSAVGRTSSGSWGPDPAFDGVLDHNAAVVSMANAPVWLGYMFPSNVAIAEAAVRCDTNRSSAPRDFALEHSNDWGLTWTTVHGATDNIDWAPEEMRLFDLTAPASSGIRGDWHIDMSRIAGGWQVSNLASSAQNVAGSDNDPGFVLSTKTLGQTLPRYFEVMIDARGAGANSGYVGIVEEGQRAYYQALHFADRPDSIGYRENGEVRKNGAVLASGLPAYGAGDIVMVAYDPDLNTVEFGLNGLWQGTGHPTKAASNYYAAFSLRDQGDRATLIGNQADFTYAKPSGCHDLAA